MKQATFLSFTALFCVLAYFTGSTSLAYAADRPNIIWVFCDDLGWPDLGVQGYSDDIATPHLDALAERGVRFTSGYITAPQCSPSRAGLMSGRHQSRFGFDHIGQGPLPLTQTTIADRLREAGYATGMIGKWHLEPNAATTDFNESHGNAKAPPIDVALQYFPENRGFDETYKGEMQRYRRTYKLNGEDLDDGQTLETVNHPRYRLTIQTDAALAFINRHQDNPFFLYLAYFAPHVPLEATPELLARFPGEMPERRRYALAMISAMDDGIGRITKRLEKLGLDENTMIVFLSDNGAPIKVDKKDIPLTFKGGAWDGSINDPLNGEKGTLLEGGIRVPFVLAWPKAVAGGQVIDTPVSSLDLTPTALAMAGIEAEDELDGVDLLPLIRDGKPLAERALYWRFWSQAAVREGRWKLLQLGSGRRYLFDLDQDLAEQHNVIEDRPEVASKLSASLEQWAGELTPAGVPTTPLNKQEQTWFEAYLP